LDIGTHARLRMAGQVSMNDLKKGGDMRKSNMVLICVVVLVAMSGASFAGFANPGEAIRYRKAVMTIIGKHFGNLAAVVKGQKPYDKNDVERNAVVIRTVSDLSWEAVMEPGSEKGDTTLKASAMQEKEKFMGIARQFEKAVQKLADAAENGNLKDVKAQFGEVAKSCKACHSKYRK
jgi:cytochrome c556